MIPCFDDFFFFNVSKVIRHGFHSREAKYHVVVTMSGSIFVASQFVLFLMSASLKKTSHEFLWVKGRPNIPDRSTHPFVESIFIQLDNNSVNQLRYCT